MYYNGEGLECRDVDEVPPLRTALEWYEKAAEQGISAAYFTCGLKYYKGEGTCEDEEKALYWFEKAAAQGDADAERLCRELR